MNKQRGKSMKDEKRGKQRRKKDPVRTPAPDARSAKAKSETYGESSEALSDRINCESAFLGQEPGFYYQPKMMDTPWMPKVKITVDPVKEMVPFYKAAKLLCANFNHGHVCLFSRGQACKWFRDAILPANKDLQEEWAAMVKRRTNPSEPQLRTRSIFKTCECGKIFKVRSPNQWRCEACGEKNRKRLSRETSQRYRKKPTAQVSLGT